MLGLVRELVPNAFWQRVAPLLPPPRSKKKLGRPRADDRAELEATVFALRSGIPWEMLPRKQFGLSGMTTWRRLEEWTRAACGSNSRRGSCTSWDFAARWTSPVSPGEEAALHRALQVRDIPVPYLAGGTGGVLRPGARRGRLRGAPERKLARLAQHPIEARLAGHVLAPVRQPGHQFLGRDVPELLAVGHRQHAAVLDFGEAVGGPGARTVPPVLRCFRLPPALDGADRHPEPLADGLQAHALLDSLLYVRERHFSRFSSTASSSSSRCRSPQPVA
ncbi:transposase [Corallococcus sp. bb12-1]|uniref:transposase n=1 Tax=Corallococcus sp. bb12-1 TaxID=2996784 RepID=UPI003B63B0FE